MNYYERHIGDYLKDTAHLSLLEHGIYGRLLDIYYGREVGIPVEQVARLVGARSPEEVAALDCVLVEFFEQAGGAWVQTRCEEEIARFQDKQRKAKASAAASWANRRAEQSQSERIADAKQTHSGGNAPSLQTPDPIPKREKKPAAPSLTVEELKDEGLAEETATEFIAHRNRKGAKLTRRAWDGVKAEIAKAGWTPEMAIAKCLARGWVAFESDWVKDEKTRREDIAHVTVPGPPPSTFLAEQAAHRAEVEAERIARKHREAA